MQEPRAVVVSDKANGDVVASISDGDDVAADGVLIVVHRASGTSNDREGMLEKLVSFETLRDVGYTYAVKMERMLQGEGTYENKSLQKEKKLTGPPLTPPGIEISMTLFGGSV